MEGTTTDARLPRPHHLTGHWRADASAMQLLRAARGLEAIAHTCAGARRGELLALVEDLRDRAWSRRASEVQRARRLAPATLG